MSLAKIERWIRWTERKVDEVLEVTIEPGLGCVDSDGYPVLSGLMQQWECRSTSPVNTLLNEVFL